MRCGPLNHCAPPRPARAELLTPFVLSLSKHERSQPAIFKTKTVGGSPTASHFSCLAKKSNQKKSPLVCRPLRGFPRKTANKRGCATRPSGAHTPCPAAE